ncbi:MAG: EAL domain-containing protein [Helicobacteraceae bacterium]|nr:EAL domain-containing protein [Helicobacteraceae bacterium]
MKKGIFFKRIDAISLLLYTFIFFLVILFIYLVKVNRHIDNFSNYNDTIHELKIIDKEFDNFLLQQATFINYDKINKSMQKFDEGMLFLDSEISHELFPKKYNLLLEKIEKLYKIKVTSMEYFKSENSQLLYSIHYLFEINNAIIKTNNLNKKTVTILNNTLLNLMKYYTNSRVDRAHIYKNIKYLQNYNSNESVELFIEHVNNNLIRIEEFNKIKNIQKEDRIVRVLEDLHQYLITEYQENIIIEKIILIMLFAFALIILVALIIMSKNSTKLKDELLGFKTAVENGDNSVIITDINSNITYINDVVINETGYSSAELLGQNPRILKSGMTVESDYQELRKALDGGKKWEGEFKNRRKDGTIFYEKASIMPIYHDNKITHYLAIKLNITNYVEEKQKVEHMAYFDALTELPNRLSVEKYLKDRLPIAKRNSSKFAILFIDLDRFKIINDTLGHDVGDELLIGCAARIRKALRDSDLLARVGGDEFVIVMEAPNSDFSAAHVCKKIINLFHTPIKIKDHTLSITLSIGVSMYPDDNSDYKKLIKFADIAMYEAKDSGKNTYRYYQSRLSIDAHKRLNMEQSLKTALENSEIYMMYQPQYLLKNREIVGLEALVRWESEALGFVPPDLFIPIAEDTGAIVEIGLFIFKRACLDFLVFAKECATLKNISINISAVQLYQDTFISDIMGIVKDVEIEPRVIQLEITETHIMKNIDQSMKLLEELQELGFRISIDDFGTGHSSLRYLKLFPINELKIDKSFIDDLPDSKDDSAITSAIITLSKSLEYINVAEGIELEEQEAFLREHNCSIGQGYLFSKPKLKDDLIEFLKAN